MRKKNGSALFLMELIIIIMFFSLAAAVCINIFVSAHLKSEASENITKAVFYSQSIAEVYTSVRGDLSELPDYFPECAKATDSQLTLAFDKDWKSTGDLSEAAFTVTLLVTDASPLQEAVITTAGSDGSVIFELPLTVYRAR